VFTVSGLDFESWGVTTLILGVLSGLAPLTELYWAKTDSTHAGQSRLPGRWSSPRWRA
jgi:hypothetical protein